MQGKRFVAGRGSRTWVTIAITKYPGSVGFIARCAAASGDYFRRGIPGGGNVILSFSAKFY